MKELWVPLSGAVANQRSVDTIANNVANVNTPGFKKDQITFKEHLTALENGHNEIDLPNKEFRPEDFYRSFGAEHAFVKTDANYIDFSQGRLSNTGNPFDLAIQGQGMFEVLTPNGIRYTRNGSFSMDRNGAVVNSSGHFLLSKLGKISNPEQPMPTPEDRKIFLTPGRPSISQNGEIFINENKIADLSVVEFKDINALRKDGTSYYVSNHPENLIPDNVASVVHQGMIEESNVNSIEEMSNLIKANRNFENIQKVIKTYDTIAGQAISEIAKF